MSAGLSVVLLLVVIIRIVRRELRRCTRLVAPTRLIAIVSSRGACRRRRTIATTATAIISAEPSLVGIGRRQSGCGLLWCGALAADVDHQPEPGTAIVHHLAPLGRRFDRAGLR